MDDGGEIRSFVCAVPGCSLDGAESFAQKLRGYPGFKWVAPSNWHITLAFLGETDPASVQRVASSLSRIGGVRPFRVRVLGLGAYPSLESPRVLWLGVREGAREAEKLASLVARSIRGAGVELARSRFKAHMTIGRARGEARIAPDLAHLLETAPELEWECRSFVYMRSSLTPKGPIYTPIEVFDL